jgi:hypothetical protein
MAKIITPEDLAEHVQTFSVEVKNPGYYSFVSYGMTIAFLFLMENYTPPFFSNN